MTIINVLPSNENVYNLLTLLHISYTEDFYSGYYSDRTYMLFLHQFDFICDD